MRPSWKPSGWRSARKIAADETAVGLPCTASYSDFRVRSFLLLLPIDAGKRQEPKYLFVCVRLQGQDHDIRLKTPMKYTVRLVVILLIILLCLSLFCFYGDVNFYPFGTVNEKPKVQSKLRDSEAFGPEDSFYRVLMANDPKNYVKREGVTFVQENDIIYEVIKEWVKKDDIVAQSATSIKKGLWRFRLFGGPDNFTGKYWIENTSWCIRLKFKPGQEKQFTHTLMRLAQTGYGDDLGLPAIRRGADLTIESASFPVNPQDKNGMLIPVNTNLEGRSAAEIDNNQWWIDRDSKICDNISKK